MTEAHDDSVLTVDEILDADDIVEKWIDVPEWPKNGKPGRVKIRPLDLRQLSTVARRASRRNAQGQDEIDRELMVIYTVLDGMVEPKLTPETARKLATKSAGAVSRIAAAINSLGVTPEAIDEADKSLWPEPVAPLPIPASEGTPHDLASTGTGNGHSGIRALDSVLPA